MQEFTTPTSVTVPTDDNTTTALWEWERTNPDKTVMAHRPDGGAFVDISYGELASKARRVAAGLMSLGLGKGDMVCIYSPTRYEYTILNYGIWAAGCAVVTIYETSAADQVEWIVQDSGATALICANGALEATFQEKAGKLGTCEHVYSLDEGGFDALVGAGAGISDADVMERAQSVTHDDIATLIYTSGTTGKPKGCVLSVGNFQWELRQVLEASSDLINENATTLMFLPLAHVFANLVQAGQVHAGAKTAYSTGIPNLVEELSMVQPTWVFSVPRVFEKIYNTAEQRAIDAGKGSIFDKAVATAIAYSKESEDGKVGMGTKLKHMIFDKLVYGKLRATFGGKLNFALSGGAALGSRLGHFFNGVGLPVLEGYGLTETTAGSTLNRSDAMRVGTVGQPIPGVTVRIADDGEVLIKGPHIFQGYWNNDKATAEAIQDGWFHSGDIGQLDPDGYLKITGRKKELIVTAGGKNVAPAVLEDKIRASALISQCMVVGDDKPFIGALVTIDPDAFPRWAEDHDKDSPVRDLVDDADLKASVQEAIDAANATVSKAESIREFRILPQDFSIEGGELTPTLKVKRNVVAERYANNIRDIYEG
jgi:long-chain acyl-CoA synthetase